MIDDKHEIKKAQKRKSNLEWYYKHREEQIKKNKEWKIKNRERMLIQKKEYHKKNREKINAHKKEYRIKNKERYKALKKKDDAKYYRTHKEKENFKLKRKENRIRHYQENRERILAYGKQHSQIPHVKARRNEMSKIWKKNNPSSYGIRDPDLREAMNAVRIRDKNTCQWQGCGITFRQAEIHVHHIFPKSEYPDLQLVEQYMICYCANHHGYWHRMRGDRYHNMIYPSEEYLRANPEELLLGGD